jgi:hypothetical protein
VACSSGVGLAHIDILPIRVERQRTPYASIHRRKTSTAAQIVSCAPKPRERPAGRVVTKFIKQPRGRAASYHRWKLPSSCTSSPKCALRSAAHDAVTVCARDSTRRRPASSGARVVCTVIPSSLARCSAASVGPNRMSIGPLYFSRTSANTPVHVLAGPRMIRRPARAPVLHPFAPSARYRRARRFAWR